MSEKRDGKNSLSALKHKNRHRVLAVIRGCDAVSMAEIARLSGLSIMTVHNIVEHCLANKLIKPMVDWDISGERKPRAKLFSFNPDYRYVFCVKIGERKLVAALANLRGEVSVSHSEAVDADRSLDSVTDFIGDIFQSLTRRLRADPADCLGAVVGCPGIVHARSGTLVVAPHFTKWKRNIPLRDKLAERLPEDLPIVLDNSIRYNAYAELKARGDAARRFYLIGTDYENVVGGMVLDGHIERGNAGLTGEVGHMMVDSSSEIVCVCGGNGCLEVAAAPKRMEEDAVRMLADHPESTLAASVEPGESGEAERIRFAVIAAAADAGDALARKLMDRSVRYFGMAIQNIILACDPGLIVIQGSYARAGEYFLEQIRHRINGFPLFSMDKETRIECSDLDDESCLTGAAFLMADIYFDGMEYEYSRMPHMNGNNGVTGG
ncbi:MAG: ROK family protein [Planctomycetaceae bacterium]|nr:ROK family protein [Planctomycetaceae bacterium]